MPLTLQDIRNAAERIRGSLLHTPTIPSPALSDLAGAEVFLKLESLQITSSFKARGALIKLLSLDDDQRAQGVIAASAGNHAQGVAYHARRLEIPATIVMPRRTPFTKVAQTERLGARVVVDGGNFAEADTIARRMAEKEGLLYVHPYDDYAIMAGQGTLALEMLADVPDLDAVIVPIGGGGLISGVATAVKGIRPEAQVVGVQAALYPSMYQALHGQALRVGGQTVAEGIAVKTPGRLAVPIIRALVDDILLADEKALERAVQLLVNNQRLVVEGAGAAPLAALLGACGKFAGRRVGLVISGGNVDARLLSSILLRGLVREGRLVRLRIEISDSPGILAKVAKLIGECDGNILEVYHQRLFYDVPVKMAEVDVVVETLDVPHVRHLVAHLKEAGFPTRLLSNTSEEDPG